jgi:hypothetical protein
VDECKPLRTGLTTANLYGEQRMKFLPEALLSLAGTMGVHSFPISSTQSSTSSVHRITQLN